MAEEKKAEAPAAAAPTPVAAQAAPKPAGPPAPPPPKNPGKVTFTIDGQETVVAPGTSIIKAAFAMGKDIPHFCYHEGLTVVGQCRMCFVEVEGMPKLATSCSTMPMEGMKVHTASEKVKAGQNATLEFTLLHHPLDCPICDRGGECKLQDYTYEYGPPHSRMEDEKKLHDKHRHISEQIVLDQERCILCTRCVRFSSEIDGRAEITVQGRGTENVVDVFEGRPFSSKFSGNVVDLCPVGALTAQDFRFQARPWELKSHDGLCTGCSTGCNIEIHTKHRNPSIPRPENTAPRPAIERLVPRENMQVNQWWMCDKGRWGYHFHNRDELKLTDPMIRRPGAGALANSTLKEIQVLLESQKGPWEFWIDDSVPHEGIAWARELAQSWGARGRPVKGLNPSAFSPKVLEAWTKRSASPWYAQGTDWSQIKTVVATVDNRTLENIVPMLALKLGQPSRLGKIKWEVRDVASLHASGDDLATTAYLIPSPKTDADLANLAKIPAEAKTLVLWTQFNARGLLNEGIAPIEAIGAGLRNEAPKGPVFYFGQTTQNAKNIGLVEYLKKAPFLVVADSFQSELCDTASVVLPLQPLYETHLTATSLENFKQSARGIEIRHPNLVQINRGGEFVTPALRLI